MRHPGAKLTPGQPPVSPSIQYEGESTMRAYKVTIDWETKKPVSARFDMEFVAKNGEPIADLDRRIELESQLKPDRSKLTGDGIYFIDCFYYDLDCQGVRRVGRHRN